MNFTDEQWCLIEPILPPHNPAEQINPAFLSVSLRHNDGAPKPALTVWQEMINKSK